MIDYENMNDFSDVDDKTKLQIVKREIKKVVNLNNLLYHALHCYEIEDDFEAYIYATKLIGTASWHIRKMFPY